MKNFIICLSKIQASLDTATKLKNQLVEFGEEVELFEGTYGNDATKMMKDEGRKVHPWGIKGPSADPLKNVPSDPVGKIAAPGVQGCFYSHYNLWKKCIELDESIIIWEDDIRLTRPFKIVDWQDILIVALGHPKKSQRYMKYLDSPAGEAEAVEYTQSSMPGCCGYAIKPHAAKKLLEIYKNTYLPADNAINQHHVSIQIHNYIMGIAMIKKDGKKSLTRTNFWNVQK
jgi:GR25 family glycosyltransferase involved in LPS biosynthesis